MISGAQQKPKSYIAWFDELGANDVENVGGTNAPLGERTEASAK